MEFIALPKKQAARVKQGWRRHGRNAWAVRQRWAIGWRGLMGAVRVYLLALHSAGLRAASSTFEVENLVDKLFSDAGLPNGRDCAA